MPAWVTGVVQAAAALHDAEAVFLVGSHARGNPRPDSDVNLLVVVDPAALGSPRLVVEARRSTMEGFARPVTVLLASLAEMGAGIYSGHRAWIRLAADAWPLYDPAGIAGLLAERLASAPVEPEHPA